MIRRTKRNFFVSKEDLEFMYTESGISAIEIAGQFGWHDSTVCERLREYKIPVRSHAEALNMPLYLSKLRGRKYPEEVGQKISRRMMGNTYGRGNKGKTGRQNTKESNEKNRQSQLKRYQDPQERAKIGIASRIAHSRPESREKHIAGAKMMWDRLSYRKKMETIRTSLGFRARQSEATKDVWNRPGYRKKMSKIAAKARKRLWANFTQEERDARILAIQKGNIKKPNKAELCLANLLDSAFPNEWKYVGDWGIIIEGKCPDFININGKKLIIELFGDYWHRGENPKIRKEIFKRYGYTTLIIWENELSNCNKVLAMVTKFTKQGDLS